MECPIPTLLLQECLVFGACQADIRRVLATDALYIFEMS